MALIIHKVLKIRTTELDSADLCTQTCYRH
jgi:hypothetical protein